MIRSQPEYLLEVLESLVDAVLVVEAQAANINGISTHAIHAENIAANTTTQTSFPFTFLYSIDK